MDNVFAMSGQGAAYATDGGCAGDGTLTVVSGGSDATGADDVPLLPLREKNAFSRKVDRRGGARGSVLSYRVAGSSTYASVHVADDDVVTADFEVLGSGDAAAEPLDGSRYDVPQDAASYHDVAMGARVCRTFPDAEATRAAERLEGRVGYRFVKRAFDVVFSLFVFALLWWLFLIVAVAIKLDSPGPVLFNQERVGKDGRTFKMYKFRSMFTDAEDRLESLQSLNEKDGPVFKIKHDPRVTRVGRFIRKTSLDELPQFLNVFLGNMSIVGPRPALPREVCQYTPYERQRLLIKPGITCYWQTRRNRDDIGFDEWVALDLLYIKQCSFWSDFKLIIQTIGVVLTAQGN